MNLKHKLKRKKQSKIYTFNSLRNEQKKLERKNLKYSDLSIIKETFFDIIIKDQMENIWTRREVDINLLPIYEHRLNLKYDIDKQTNFEIPNIKKIEIINLKNDINGNNIIFKNNNNNNNINSPNLKRNNPNIQNKFNLNSTFQIVNNESISLMSQISFIQQSQRLLKDMNSGLNHLKTEPEFRLNNDINNSLNQNNKLYEFLPKIKSHSQSRKKEVLNKTEINYDIIQLDSEYETLKNNLKEINP